MKQIPLEDEYKKDTGVTPQDIAKLRQWLKTQPHLPEQHITDLDLILTFHCCNCSTGLAKQVLDLNLTLRTLFHAFYKDRDIESTINVVKNIVIASLPMPSQDGYKICYGRLMNVDPKIFHYGNAMRAVLMVLEISQYEEGTWPGFMLVVDFAGITLSHFAKIDLSTLQQFLYFIQEAVLVKLKALHFVNAPSFIDKLLMMMRPFMKKELMDMLHVHTAGSDTLKNFLPIEALPAEWNGGQGDSFEKIQESTIEKLYEYKQYFEEESHKRVTESLRPGKPKTISDIFGGVEGSFKKLEID